MADLFVTNFNRNFTGVSATAANVIRQQAERYDLRLVGAPLPGCPAPITVAQARDQSRHAGTGPVIWHVRRNPEMRAALWARDVLRLPIRIVFTSAAQRLHSAYPRWLISRMDAVIATTQQAAGFVPHVRAVVPHGVDTDLFQPLGGAADWPSLGYGGTQGIATLGRIRPEKGTDLFVQMLIKALPTLPGTTALIIGKATREHQGFLADLRDQIATAGLSERIRFVGELPVSDLPGLLPHLKLIVQLPRYEGYGMVPLEGMACGVPFVSTDAGSYSAFSAQGRCGWVVEQQDWRGAADAVQTLLRDPVRHAAMSVAARDVAQQSFSARAEADGIGAVYDQLRA